MNRFFTLIKREFWEHKRSALWTPVLIVLIVTLLITLGLFQVTQEHNVSEVFNTANVFISLPVGIIPMFLLGFLPLIITSYALSSLYEERSNKSIFFWRSMPISDTQTVISKVIFGLIVLPLLFIAVWLIFILLMVIKQFAFEVIFTHTDASEGFKVKDAYVLFQLFITISLGFLTFSVVSLPYFGYLLFVSAVSNRSPWLVALLPFVLLFVINLTFPQTTVVYEYLFIPFELAVKSSVSVMKLTSESVGLIDTFARVFEFDMDEYQQFMQNGYEKTKTIKSDGVTITREVSVDVSPFFFHAKNVVAVLVSLAIGVAFITLSIFARKRIHSA